MSASAALENGNRLVRDAVEMHRRGQLAAAEQRYRALLQLDPVPSEAGALLGLLLLDQGRHAEARAELLAAVGREACSVLARSALGTVHLRAREWQEASDQLQAACALVSEDPDLHKNLGTARKNLGDVQGAVVAYRQSLALRRSYDPRRATAITERATNGVKLEHDLAQITELMRRYPGRSDFLEIRRALVEELSSNARYRGAPFQLAALGPASSRRIGWFYNRLVHEPQIVAPEQVLSRPSDLTLRQGEIADDGTSFIVIDDFLAPEALAGIRRLSEEATFWFEPKDHGGHVGAYLDEGFDHPLILSIASQTRAAMPRILDNSVLKQAWAYKYDNRGGGTRIHADQAAFTLNLWITADESNLDGGGGLIMTDAAAPIDWGFAQYNGDVRAIEAYLHRRDAKFTRIAHKANRAVFFKSHYFHATEAFHFGSAYVDRRVNVSFMFGDVQ